jgi:hypothetical protein
VVFQPLTDEAAAAAREYAFAYQADSEVVQLRAAKVYREGGKIDEAIESGEGPADNPAIATYTSAALAACAATPTPMAAAGSMSASTTPAAIGSPKQP